MPYLNSLKTLGKYFLFGVILIPFASALVGANASGPGGYGLQWRVWFFADALAFLTVTPAILNWAHEGRAWARQHRNYLEFAALMTSLVIFGYFAFVGTVQRNDDQPALLYSLVPLLIWAALRLGLKGVSSSVLVLAILSIWGVSHGRGPFARQGPLHNALSLQLFLFFVAIPFTFLAVLVEEQKRAQQILIDDEARLAEAQRLAHVGSWQWDLQTDMVTWSEELYRMAGRDSDLPAPSYEEHAQLFTLESWERLQAAVGESLRTGRAYELDLEMIRPDGTTRWIIARGETQQDPAGHIVSLRGTAKDITDRKQAEDALRESEQRFRLVANTAPVMIWMTGPDKQCTFLNQTWRDFTGRSAETEPMGAWQEDIHPGDSKRTWIRTRTLLRDVNHSGSSTGFGGTTGNIDGCSMLACQDLMRTALSPGISAPVWTLPTVRKRKKPSLR